MLETERVKHMIKRLARMDADGSWSDGLNPAQRMALEYLARANRFSRKPSDVAEFMGSTRGTISQTLKALCANGYVAETRSDTDKRSLSYELTKQGRKALTSSDLLGSTLDVLASRELQNLSDSLSIIVDQALKKNGQKAFGICKQCQHFSSRKTGGFCKLLEVPLERSETEKICVEQRSSA